MHCTWSMLLWNCLNAQRSLKIVPFSLQGGYLLAQELHTAGMFNRPLSHIVVAYFKSVYTTVVHALKCIFYFFDEHIKGRSYILCVVFDHSLLDISQLIFS